jgi:hypothetical protein
MVVPGDEHACEGVLNAKRRDQERRYAKRMAHGRYKNRWRNLGTETDGVRVCPVCWGWVEQSETGRRARFCSDYCRTAAARKRREVRLLLECAARHVEYARQTRVGEMRHMGSAEYLEQRARELRGCADVALAEIGEAGRSSQRERSPALTSRMPSSK